MNYPFYVETNTGGPPHRMPRACPGVYCREVRVTIRDILRRKGQRVVTITPDCTVLEAVNTLVAHNIGGLVVTSGDRPIGILTERDVLRLTARAPGQLQSFEVGAVMTRELILATPEHDLHEAMGLMTERKIRHLPVMNGDALAGIVSIGDLVNACRELAEDENQHLRGYIQGVPAEAAGGQPPAPAPPVS